MGKIGTSYKIKSQLDSLAATDIQDTFQLTIFDPSIGENKEFVTNYGDFINELQSTLTFPDKEVFTPTVAQTVFTLTQKIPNASEILNSRVYLNGQKLTLSTCYTISGTTLTIMLPYDLDSTDLLEIYY